MIFTCKYKSAIEEIILTSDGINLLNVSFKAQYNSSLNAKAHLQERADLDIFKQTKHWFDCYFKGEPISCNHLQLKFTGSDFRIKVCKLLLKIPFGEITTYGNLAKIMAMQTNKRKLSAQAIGGAIKHNPFSIIVPCHRVVGSKNNLVGYAGGIHFKIQLLHHEKVNLQPYLKTRNQKETNTNEQLKMREDSKT